MHRESHDHESTAVVVRSYRDLRVWQKGLNLVEDTYELTRGFPDHERFGLTQQMRRGAVSIPANIAEGHGRRGSGEYLYHLSVANGSLMELETHVIIAHRLGYVDGTDCSRMLQAASVLGRMIAGLSRAVGRRRGRRGTRTPGPESRSR